MDTPQEIRPSKVAPKRAYAITPRLWEAGADGPKGDCVCCFPKVTFGDGKFVDLDMNQIPQNLLAKVVEDEKIKIGVSVGLRVTRMWEPNKVRLLCSLQSNEVEKSSVSELRVLGSTVQTIQVVELNEPVKIVLQKDAGGSAQRWVEFTVDEIEVDE